MPRLRSLPVVARCPLALVLALLLVLPLALPVGAVDAPMWRETGLRVGASACTAPLIPGVFYTTERTAQATTAPRVTYANNYRTGERTRIAMRGFDVCDSATGALFVRDADGTIVRFTAADPTGTTIAHLPEQIAGGVYYALDPGDRDDAGSAHHLFVSTDGGQAWEERGAQLAGIVGIAPTPAGDGRGVYALVSSTQANNDQTWAVQFSADAGLTWEVRSSGTDAYNPIARSTARRMVRIVPGAGTPATTVAMIVALPATGPHGTTVVQLSADGGCTFGEVGSIRYGTTGPDLSTDLYGTSAGILRLTQTFTTAMLSLSTDGGATFTPTALPPVRDTYGLSPAFQIAVAPAAPGIVLLSGGAGSGLYLSRDGGQTWEAYGTAQGETTIMPTSPPVALGLTNHGTDGRLLALDLPPATVNP